MDFAKNRSFFYGPLTRLVLNYISEVRLQNHHENSSENLARQEYPCSFKLHYIQSLLFNNCLDEFFPV